MNKIKMAVIVLACCVFNYVSAHSSQISTITISKKDTAWSLHISSSFDAFYYELTKKYPQTDFNKISKEALTDLLIKEVGNSIDMIANKTAKIKLQNGAVQVGHQTDLWFDIKGMPKDLTQLYVEAHTFSNITQHNYILLMPKNETYEKFILGSNNSNTMNFEVHKGSIFKAIPIESKNSILQFSLIGMALLITSILLINFKTTEMNFKKLKISKLAFGAIVALTMMSCSKTDDTTTPTTSSTEVPAVYKKIYGATSITSDGTWIYIKSKNLPDHKSSYYPTSNALYEAYSGTTFSGVTFKKNPNTIVEQSATLKIPLNPVVATNHAATPLGVIGIALNGVALFNQYAGPNNQALSGEIVSFDKYYGHPQNTGVYHYHVEPLYLTTVKSTKSGLMGFLLDGFPVYGPQEEDGTTVTNSLLDAYHGHTHKTVDYPNGIYHYHFTTEAPYLNGSGFYGTAGTVTQ